MTITVARELTEQDLINIVEVAKEERQSATNTIWVDALLRLECAAEQLRVLKVAAAGSAD